MLDLGVTLVETEYPNNLPIGSGNECEGLSSRRFFSSDANAILSEISGTIALEDDTNSVAEA